MGIGAGPRSGTAAHRGRSRPARIASFAILGSALSSASSTRLATARLFLLGASTALFQTLFSRELLSAFSGNEAVLAALLAPWLVLTSGGALAARKRLPRPSLALALLGPAAVCSLASARLLPMTFAGGAAPGTGTALVWSFILLAPACLLSGLAFTWLVAGRGDSGRGYLAESLGAGVAGALASLLLLGWLPTFSLAALALVASGLGAVLGLARRRALLAALPSLAVAGALFALPVGPWLLGLQAEHLRGAVERESPFGSLVIVDRRGQLEVFADRLPVVAGLDPAAAEEAAHLPLALVESPSSVAIIGVPPAGAVAELLAHGVARLDYVLEDQVLLGALGERLAELRDERVRLHAADPRRWLQGRAGAFDAILLFSPEPTSAQLNRTFTAEFFSVAARALAPGGLVAVSLPGHAEYASHEKRRLHSSVRRTLDSVFARSLTLPAGATLYLARASGDLPEKELPGAIAGALSARGIAPAHLNRASLEGLLSKRRLEDAERWSSLAEPVNRDLRPTTYHLALEQALAELGEVGSGGLLLLALALIVGALLVFGPRSRPLDFAVFTSGAGGMANQLLLMLAYQLAAGALYREIGLLLAGFMFGAAAGAWLGERRAPRIVAIGADAAQLLFALLFALALPGLVSSGPWARGLGFAATFVAGLLPGLQFTAAARAVGGPAASVGGRLYAADLMGAALAALVTFTFLVPTLGLRGTALAVAGLKLLSLLALLAFREEPKEMRSNALPALLPLAFVALVAAAAGAPGQGRLFALGSSRPYGLAVALGLLLCLLAAFEPKRVHALIVAASRRVRALGVGVERAAYFVLLSPLAALPLGRCYFEVPFVLCHACPRPCVFGVFRRYLVLVALVANLHDRRFCERTCPLGAAQVACGRVRGRSLRRLPLARGLRLVSLLLVAVAWFAARGARGEGVEGQGVYALFFKNAFTPSLAVLAVSLGLLLLSFFVRRPFCEALCPIGAASSLIGGLERRLDRRPAGLDAPAAGGEG